MPASDPSSTNTNLNEDVSSQENDTLQMFEQWLFKTNNNKSSSSNEVQQCTATPTASKQEKGNKFQMFQLWMRDNCLMNLHRANNDKFRCVDAASDELLLINSNKKVRMPSTLDQKPQIVSQTQANHASHNYHHRLHFPIMDS